MIELETIFESLLIWTIAGCVLLVVVGSYAIRFLRLGIRFFKERLE